MSKKKSTSSNAYETWLKNNQNTFISSQDDSLARTNDDFARSLMVNKDAWTQGQASGNQEVKTASNQALNDSRLLYGGYSGGTDGSAYSIGDGKTVNQIAVPATAVTTPTTASHGSGGQVSPYQAIAMQQEQFAKKQEAQTKKLYNATIQQGTDQLNAQRNDINQASDEQARQAYISYMQGQRNMPAQLATAGITGGMAESTMLGARAGYESNLNAVNIARQQAMQDIDIAIMDLQNSGNIEMAQKILENSEKIADYYVQAQYADIERNDALDQFALQESNVTGEYKGNPTYEAQQNAYKQALAFAQQTGDYSVLKQFGLDDETIQALSQQYLGSNTTAKTTPSKPQTKDTSTENNSIEPSVANQTDSKVNDWVRVPGYSRLTFAELEKLVDSGEIIEEYDETTGKYSYRKNPYYKK